VYRVVTDIRASLLRAYTQFKKHKAAKNQKKNLIRLEFFSRLKIVIDYHIFPFLDPSLGCCDHAHILSTFKLTVPTAVRITIAKWKETLTPPSCSRDKEETTRRFFERD